MGATTRLECRVGTSSKFYEVEPVGNELVCRYGRIGGKVRELRRRCSSDVYAWRRGQRTIAEKVAKGYRVAVGAPCEAPGLLLGYKWTGEKDLSGWLVSEKFDGCRLYWDGERFWTKGGAVVHAPSWFVEGLPNRPLDCELWAGRGLLGVAHAAIKGNAQAWRRCKLMVFDAPGEGEFSERIELAKSLVSAAPHAMCVEHRPAMCNADVVGRLRREAAMGAEGLVARDPHAAYVAGRMPSVQKIKLHYIS